MELTIRRETEADITAIRALITRALADDYHSWHNEQELVEELRDADRLALSLVAIAETDIVGFLGATRVRLRDSTGWCVLGPLAVEPPARRRGVGTGLVTRAVEELRDAGTSGVAALGNPEFYRRFGFRPAPGIRLDIERGTGPEVEVLALPLRGDRVPSGVIPPLAHRGDGA